MSRAGRLQEPRASILIVPTTTSYELEPSQLHRAPRKRKHCAPLSVLPHCWTSCRDAGWPCTLSRVQLITSTLLAAGGGKSSSAVASEDQTYCPKNYLMSGGHRAAAKDREDQLLQLNRAAIKVCSLHVRGNTPRIYRSPTSSVYRTCGMPILLWPMSCPEPGSPAKRYAYFDVLCCVTVCAC